MWNLTDPSKTLDGVTVAPGLYVWDYDLRRGIVLEVEYTEPLREGQKAPVTWWKVRQVNEDGTPGERTKMFDASRMWARHPSTGKPAADFVQSSVKRGA